MNGFWPYASSLAAFLAVFLPWELTALRKKRDHITMSEYVWKFEGKSGLRKAGVALGIIGLAGVSLGHFTGWYLK